MKSEFEDYLIDAKLHIETVGRNDSFSTDHLYPYEPTSYPVLDRLIEDEYIAYLSTFNEVMFVDEIDCTDLFEEERIWRKPYSGSVLTTGRRRRRGHYILSEEKDSRNRIMIYETNRQDYVVIKG